MIKKDELDNELLNDIVKYFIDNKFISPNNKHFIKLSFIDKVPVLVFPLYFLVKKDSIDVFKKSKFVLEIIQFFSYKKNNFYGKILFLTLKNLTQKNKYHGIIYDFLDSESLNVEYNLKFIPGSKTNWEIGEINEMIL